MDEKLSEAKETVLASGDSFVTDSELHLEGLEIAIDLIDMEAFALHKVYQYHHTAFACYKYVTDNSDDEASTDWGKILLKALSFLRLYCLGIMGRFDDSRLYKLASH